MITITPGSDDDAGYAIAWWDDEYGIAADCEAFVSFVEAAGFKPSTVQCDEETFRGATADGTQPVVIDDGQFWFTGSTPSKYTRLVREHYRG